MSISCDCAETLRNAPPLTELNRVLFQDDFSPTSKLQRLLAESRQMVTDLELSTLLPISCENLNRSVRSPFFVLKKKCVGVLQGGACISLSLSPPFSPPPPPVCVSYVGQKTASALSDVAQELSALLFETRSLKDLELTDEARPGWPASPRDPPSPPALGLQEHYHVWLFMQVLGIKLRSSCLHG